jgi:two-component system, OmpR family, sensor kinase
MRRVPIRLRLTLTFAAVTAVILFVLALVLHAVFQAELTRGIDMELRSRAEVVRAAIERRDPAVMLAGGNLIDPDEAFAQVLSPTDRIVASTSGVAGRPMLTPGQVKGASAGPVFLTTMVAGVDDPVRLLAVPVTRSGQRVVVVGSTLGDRNEAISRLRTLLVVFGAVALALVTVGGWWVVGSALRPVERMRVEAGAISETELGRRLQVPPARDELSRLATTLNSLLTRLQEAFRRKGEFLDRASHELRTPLSVLKMELELAAHRGATRAELMRAIANASSEADRLALLADDLLVLARLRDGRLPIRRAEVDVGNLVRGVCTAQTVRAGAAGSRITCSAADLVAEVDPSRVRQALDDLLDNAIVHAGGGSIDVVVEGAPGEVRIGVRDRGRGFPPELLAGAEGAAGAEGPAPPGPNPIAEGDGTPVGSGPGSHAGLGLSIARAIAEAHGGRLELTNEPGGGARAVLVFGIPQAAIADAAHQPAARGRPVAG